MKLARSFVLIIMSALFSCGCGRSPQKDLDKLANAYGPSPDTDVTKAAFFNFTSFADTSWKTKVQLAIAVLPRYTGDPQTIILTPDAFDTNHPRYNPPSNMKLKAILPAGSRIRILGLMKDNGVWGGVQVQGTLEEGTNAQLVAYMDRKLFSNNKFLRLGPTHSTNWGVNAEFLEQADQSELDMPSKASTNP